MKSTSLAQKLVADPIDVVLQESSDGGLPLAATEYATQGVGRKLRDELPHLRLVAPLRPERASRGFFVVLVSAMLAFGLVVMLLVNTSVGQTAFTVSELKIQQRDLSRAEAAMTKSIAEAASPPVLEAKARALGMIPSDRAVFLTVPSGKVRGKAKPAPGNRSRTANVAGSLTATLVDPVPTQDVVDVTTGAGIGPGAGERRQVGDGAVLIDPETQSLANEATEQARRNEQRQQQRAAANGDGAQLVDVGQSGRGTDDRARVEAGGAE